MSGATLRKDWASPDAIPSVEEQGRPLPEIEDAANLLKEDIDKPVELVAGLLHMGSKMVVGATSKAKKTFILLNLAISVACGIEWFGRRTQQAAVLYINLEIQRVFFQHRIAAILAKLGLALETGYLDLLNLRGYAADITSLIPKILTKIKERPYALIIVDPIYKCLGKRDENRAGDIAGLLNELERLAVESGAAVAFGAHFSKGNQSVKESIDRIGGSGVFARDPDTILTMTTHKEPDAFTVEATLRNLAPIEPFCVRWDYPVMKLAADLHPEDLKQKGGSGKPVPSEDELLAAFPKTYPSGNPRAALFSNSELTHWFKEHNFDKDAAVALRDRLEKRGEIRVLRGLPRNEILAGRPAAAEAYERARAANQTSTGRKSKRKEAQTK